MCGPDGGAFIFWVLKWMRERERERGIERERERRSLGKKSGGWCDE
jgi:hypothetical protein